MPLPLILVKNRRFSVNFTNVLLDRFLCYFTKLTFWVQLFLPHRNIFSILNDGFQLFNMRIRD
jgi:hypothetical protein